MNDQWILWEFFPWWINPYYFNDTMAYIIDKSFSKEEVEKDWYMWRDKQIKVDIPQSVDVIQTQDLDKYQWYNEKWNWYINPEILKKVIQDKKWNYYKIVKMEYDFLMKYWLPLPKNHWFDRLTQWFDFEE